MQLSYLSFFITSSTKYHMVFEIYSKFSNKLVLKIEDKKTIQFLKSLLKLCKRGFSLASLAQTRWNERYAAKGLIQHWILTSTFS